MRDNVPVHCQFTLIFRMRTFIRSDEDFITSFLTMVGLDTGSGLELSTRRPIEPHVEGFFPKGRIPMRDNTLRRFRRIR